jgi:hypothetical protein
MGAQGQVHFQRGYGTCISQLPAGEGPGLIAAPLSSASVTFSQRGVPGAQLTH